MSGNFRRWPKKPWGAWGYDIWFMRVCWFDILQRWKHSQISTLQVFRNVKKMDCILTCKAFRVVRLIVDCTVSCNNFLWVLQAHFLTVYTKIGDGKSCTSVASNYVVKSEKAQRGIYPTPRPRRLTRFAPPLKKWVLHVCETCRDRADLKI